MEDLGILLYFLQYELWLFTHDCQRSLNVWNFYLNEFALLNFHNRFKNKLTNQLFVYPKVQWVVLVFKKEQNILLVIHWHIISDIKIRQGNILN